MPQQYKTFITKACILECSSPCIAITLNKGNLNVPVCLFLFPATGGSLELKAWSGMGQILRYQWKEMTSRFYPIQCFQGVPHCGFSYTCTMYMETTQQVDLLP